MQAALFEICIRNLLRDKYGCVFESEDPRAVSCMVKEIITHTNRGALPEKTGLFVRRQSDNHHQFLQRHLQASVVYGLPIVHVTVDDQLSNADTARAINKILTSPQIPRRSHAKDLAGSKTTVFFLDRSGVIHSLDPLGHLRFLQLIQHHKIGTKHKRGVVVVKDGGQLAIKAGNHLYELGVASFLGGHWSRRLRGMVPSRTVTFKPALRKDGTAVAMEVRLAKSMSRSQYRNSATQ